ncbi:hypothetical protein HY17_18195 [Hyphomonas sp. CY54-11-8]|nr:hypothetical protein HY17_18195 [Hyphomonas sp. CY54-11-8]
MSIYIFLDLEIFVAYKRRMMNKTVKRGKGRPAAGGKHVVDEEKCMEIALETFAEFGFEGASVRDISRKSGISHSLLNAKYGSKRDLWTAAFDFGMDRLYDRMAAYEQTEAPEDNLPDQLRQVSLNFLMGLVESPTIFMIMNAEGGHQSDRLDYIVQKFFHQRNWAFTDILKKGQSKGVFKKVNPVVPFTLLAHGAGAMLALRPLIKTVDPRLTASDRAVQKSLEDAVDIIVTGLLAG